MEKINRTLAILSTRTIDSGHCIRFQSKFYFPVTENGDRIFFAGKTSCMVIETFDGQLLANIADNLYLMEEVAEHELV
ncbi:ISNCY family transposase, partial [Catenibacterium mitsuokai]